MQPPRNGEEGLTVNVPVPYLILIYPPAPCDSKVSFFWNLHANWQHFTGFTTPCNLLSIDSKL